MSYTIKPLSCEPTKLKGLSEKLIVSHWETNYGGAVKRLNAITAQLASLDFATAPVFLINGLKREELIATNSMILHELYFDALGADGEPDRSLREALARDFGSVDRWRTEFVAMGKAMGGGSGWVLLTYSHRDRKLVNQWAADHTHSVAGATPILALDMYEHSYHLDYARQSMSTRSWRTSTGRMSRSSTRCTRDEEEKVMKHAIVFLSLMAVVTTPAVGLAADPDWKAVEQALGKSGQMQPGEVFRIGMPRTDLNVTVKGVPVKAGFALGSYAAFKQVGDQAMVMGDLVLLDQEVPGVMSGLLSGGLEVTAVHNHLNEMSPHVMYMHYGGHGDAVQMAKALRQALSASGTPLGSSGAAPAASPSPGLDTKQIEQVLGRQGRDLGSGVFQVTAPRAEAITEMGQPLLPAMGVVTVLNFQPTADGKTAITGDFVLIDKEVNAVARTLRQHGIDVTALHNHALMDTPRLFYMHFWANDDPAKLAQGLKAALDQTNSRQ